MRVLERDPRQFYRHKTDRTSIRRILHAVDGLAVGKSRYPSAYGKPVSAAFDFCRLPNPDCVCVGPGSALECPGRIRSEELGDAHGLAFV